MLGEGVTLAKRVEDKAGPGDVLISDQTYRALEEPLKSYFQPAEQHIPQGFDDPLHSWLYNVHKTNDDRLAPLYIARRFFDQSGYKLKSLPGSALFLLDADEQISGIAVVWRGVRDKLVGDLAELTSHDRYRFSDKNQLFIVYDDQGPTDEDFQFLHQQLNADIIPMPASRLEQALSSRDCSGVLKELEESSLRQE